MKVGVVMIDKKEIIADMHTHTIASKHAYSTINENIYVAKLNGLKYLAVTDHYYGNGDAIEKKNEVTRIRFIENNVKPAGLTLIGGCEFNLCQRIENDYIEKLNQLRWRPIGLHTWFVNFDDPNFNLNSVYNYFVMAYKRDKHNAFCHIEREIFKIRDSDIDKDTGLGKKVTDFYVNLVDFAVSNGILLEVNESSLINNEFNAINRMLFWIKYAKEKGANIYLGSDAHWSESVGNFNNVLQLLNSLDYPKDKILNCNEDMLIETLGF